MAESPVRTRRGAAEIEAAILTATLELVGPLGAACAVLYCERSAKPEVRAAAEQTGLGSRRRAIALILERAVAAGVLRPAVLVSEAPDAGTALLLFHHLDGGPVDHALADAILDDVVWPAVERWAL